MGPTFSFRVEHPLWPELHLEQCEAVEAKPKDEAGDQEDQQLHWDQDQLDRQKFKQPAKDKFKQVKQ